MLSGCRIFFPDRLFQIEEEKLTMADSIKTPSEYVIRNGDLLAIGIFSNNGYELVDVINPNNNTFSALQYVVKENGYIMLPMLDSIFVLGLTLSEAERILESKYSYYFVNPFVRLDVKNRNVYVFRGRQGATVVTLDRENMNLIEVIGKAEGIPIGGKAYRVRVLRGNLNNPTVFDIDLSTIEGMSKANLIMEANDVIYIESRLTSADVLNQLTPLLSLISTLFLLTYSIVALSKL
jgi:polysaccharide biosynthesis/export protein